MKTKNKMRRKREVGEDGKGGEGRGGMGRERKRAKGRSACRGLGAGPVS